MSDIIAYYQKTKSGVLQQVTKLRTMIDQNFGTDIKSVDHDSIDQIIYCDYLIRQTIHLLEKPSTPAEDEKKTR